MKHIVLVTVVAAVLAPVHAVAATCAWVDGSDPKAPADDPGRGVSDRSQHEAHVLKGAGLKNGHKLVEARMDALKGCLDKDAYARVYADVSVLLAGHGRTSAGWKDAADPSAGADDPGRGISSWQAHADHVLAGAGLTNGAKLAGNRLLALSAKVPKDLYARIYADVSVLLVNHARGAGGPSASGADSAQCGAWMEQYGLAPYSSWGSTPANVQKLWDASDCNHKVCQYMKDKYGVVPYASWGTLPGNLQKVWDTPQVDCNHHVAGTPAAAPAPAVADNAQCGAWMEQYDLAPYSSWGSTPGHVQKLWDASDCNHKVCQYMKDKYGVVPYKSWGTLSGKLQKVWATPQVDCNHHVTDSAAAPAPAPAAATAGMGDADFQAILAAVNAEAFSENKQGALKMASKGKPFTVEQVGKLVDAFSFSEDKLNAVKQVKGQIVDPQNSFKLLGHFTFSGDKEELQKILGN